MLHLINTPQHPLLRYITDDPVRPEIPLEYRVSNGRLVLALGSDTQPSALVCVSFHDRVPQTVGDLDHTVDIPTTAVFYTIWSYAAGAGRMLLLQAVEAIKRDHPSVTRFVTLSPKTELARRFHLKNGAIVLSENDDTVNYEYVMTHAS